MADDRVVKEGLRLLVSEKKLRKPVGMSGRNQLYDCPFHSPNKSQKSPSFGIRLDNGKWNCYSCNERGTTIYSLYSALSNVPLWRAYKILGDPPPQQTDELRERLAKLSAGNQKRSARLLDPWPVCISVLDSPAALAYLHNRFMPDWLIKDAGLLHYQGDWMPRTEAPAGQQQPGRVSGNRIIIPFGINNAFYSGRALTPGDPLKYFRPVEHVGTLFYDPMHITPETSKFVVLVEGEFDALSCLRENLPTKGYFGSGLSEEQIEQLSAYEQVFMAGDMDRAGMAGMMRTKERAAGRLKLKFVAYGAKDPGALTPGFGPAFFNDLRDDFEVPPLPNTQTLLDLI